jgi:benzylsuccinate CoA-transferase BbsF subunit
MAALHERERSGEGQYVEVSQYESTAALLGAAFLDYSANGEVPGPRGNESADACPHNIYRCKGEDSWCAISVLDDAQWQALTEIDALKALRRPELSDLAGRKLHEGEIDGAIEAWTREWERHDLASYLQARGIAAGPYQDIVDMVERDPVLGDNYFANRMHPVGREFLVHGSPIVSRGSPADVRLGPLLGEHTMHVLETVLKLTADEIAELAAAGALE